MNSVASKCSQSQTAGSTLLSGYAQRSLAAERYDELCESGGTTLPHWQPVLDLLGSTQPAEIESRLAVAQQHIRDEGITYTIYADPQGKDRPWALDELPLVLPGDEWTALSYGLAQRARLLNRILADLYGSQTLLKEGIVPPEVVYGAGSQPPAP